MKATTVRFTDELYAQLERGSKLTGLPINSIVVVAVMNWLGGPHLGVVSAPIPPLAAGPRRRHRAWPELLPWRRGVAGTGPPYPFEMFTERAKQALLHAQEEADAAGSDSLTTDHLLAGLLLSEGSLAGRLLTEAGVSLDDVRRGFKRGERPERLLPTGRVKKVLDAAVKDARAAQLSYVGTEHLLLGILVAGDTRASALLEEHGLSGDFVRARLAELGEED